MIDRAARLDPRVDDYIARSADFAKPILEHVRACVHETCPSVEETLKWGMPTFVYADGILCSMAAFKRHASFGFWKHALVTGDARSGEGMGSFGKLTTVRDLPARRELTTMLRKAMKLNEAGVKTPRKRSSKVPASPSHIPEDFAKALKSNSKAAITFDHFPPGRRRDYIEWIMAAKREETRARRIAQAVEWLAEGKTRNWKYERC